MNIRDAGVEDVQDILRLMRVLAGDSDENNALTGEIAAAYLAQAGSIVLLAEHEGRTVGLLSMFMRLDLYHGGLVCAIDELVVEDGFRRQGVGSELLHEAKRRAEDAGCAEISISTLVDNQPAIRLYRRQGFVDEALLLERHFD